MHGYEFVDEQVFQSNLLLWGGVPPKGLKPNVLVVSQVPVKDLGCQGDQVVPLPLPQEVGVRWGRRVGVSRVPRGRGMEIGCLPTWRAHCLDRDPNHQGQKQQDGQRIRTFVHSYISFRE